MADTTTPTVPLTLLGAVNELLRAIGRTDVMSLATADMDATAQEALQAVSSMATEVQGYGWHFNHETEYPIDPATDGSISLPSNTAAVFVNRDRSGHLNLTQRGTKLYDLKNHTFTIDETVYVDITFLLEFAEFPPAIRWYVTAAAGYIFGVAKKPDTLTYRFSKEVRDEAYARALELNNEATTTNLAESSPHFAAMRRR